MRLKEEYKNSLALNWWNKVLAILLSISMPFVAIADPKIGDMVMPPASFTYIQDHDILMAIGLSDRGGAWCYDDDANAILISAASHESAKCELKLKYETEKLKIKHKFEVDNLNLRIESLKTQHTEIMQIKDRELERLTEAAMKVPNDYSVWWASGGFLTGVLVTVGVVFLVQND